MLTSVHVQLIQEYIYEQYLQPATSQDSPLLQNHQAYRYFMYVCYVFFFLYILLCFDQIAYIGTSLIALHIEPNELLAYFVLIESAKIIFQYSKPYNVCMRSCVIF